MKYLALTFAIAAISACDTGGIVNSQQGYQPEQPIAYSHALHAGLYELDCQYCHTGAERSRHAGVPSSSVCMNCHSQVRTDSPEIQKLANYVASDKAIPWVKVHRLPDFVYFNHASHVTAGLQCQRCHGPIEKMVRVEQQETMAMGWCLDCHREVRDVRATAPHPLATLPIEKMASPETIVSRTLTPPTDCSACHR